MKIKDEALEHQKQVKRGLRHTRETSALKRKDFEENPHVKSLSAAVSPKRKLPNEFPKKVVINDSSEDLMQMLSAAGLTGSMIGASFIDNRKKSGQNATGEAVAAELRKLDQGLSINIH